MEDNTFCNLYQSKNVIFVENIEQTVQFIGKTLPFSKVALLSFKDEYFDFGIKLKNALMRNGLKVIDFVISKNFTIEKENFNDFLSLPEDVRGIIAFNKKLIPLVCSIHLKDKLAFFIEQGISVLGVRQNRFFFRERDLLKEVSKNKQLYIMLDLEKINLESYIKSACICVNILIDYIFTKKLLREYIDMHFVNRVKSQLIDILFLLKDGQCKSVRKLKEKLFYVEELFAEKNCYYSCSAIVSSFLDIDDFFNIDFSYSASKIIIEKYTDMLSHRLKLEVIDYNEVAKTLSFVSRLNQRQVLACLDSQVKCINTKGLLAVRSEIKKLIMLYQDLAKNVQEKSFGKAYEQKLRLSVSLSGFTFLGVNGMSILQ